MLTVTTANCALYLEWNKGLTLNKLHTLVTGIEAREIEQGTHGTGSGGSLPRGAKGAWRGATALDLVGVANVGSKIKKRKRRAS